MGGAWKFSFLSGSPNVKLWKKCEKETLKICINLCSDQKTKMNVLNATVSYHWTFLFFIILHMMSLASPRTFKSQRLEKKVSRGKRHTPFLPGDYWKDQRPDFGTTDTTLNVMENSTAKFKCPITHVADSSVSFFK